MVGLPISMDGQIHGQGQWVQAFVDRLQPYIAVPVTFWDERLSTVEARRLLAQQDDAWNDELGNSEGRGRQRRTTRRRSQTKRRQRAKRLMPMPPPLSSRTIWIPWDGKQREQYEKRSTFRYHSSTTDWCCYLWFDVLCLEYNRRYFSASKPG